MSILKTNEDLRSVIGAKIPGLEDKVIDHIDEFAADYIAHSPFIVMATTDCEGNCDASPKGDAPGFVQVLDPKTIVIPDRPGNKLAYGHENILSSGKIGLLFFIPGTRETLRVNGTAQLDSSAELREELAARGKDAVLAIRVTVEECFFHCGKAVIRSNLWQTEKWESPYRVSFGEMYAKRKNAGNDVIEAVDNSIANDYKNNL
ncbi:MAG: pyridoxamine 5'-phosphate oxidase family protein [Gammaproteobacteria bacterium]|nr:pyridoxamine 5'-phosphate oxidase family protein [Gammaproteobacteria bacterium]